MFSATAAGTSGRRSGRTSRPGCWTWRWAWCGAWPGDQSQHGIRSRDPVMSCYWPASPSSPSSSPASGTSTPPCSPWCCSSRLLTAQQSKGNIIYLPSLLQRKLPPKFDISINSIFRYLLFFKASLFSRQFKPGH